MRSTRLIALVAVVAGLVLVSQAPVTGQDKGDKVTCQIIYVPTPQPVVDKMLDMAKVTDKDIVFDLGCGDGRIVATAAKKYGAKGIGVDIDPDRIKDSNETVKKLNVEKLVEIRQGDALKVKDLEKGTVVMLYMLDEFMKKLEPIAKNVVAAQLADQCEVQVSYAIGYPDPINVWVCTFGTARDGLSDEQIAELIRKHFKLTPRGIMEALNLRRPIYHETARHGHFGRELPAFTWERTDKAAALRREVGVAAMA